MTKTINQWALGLCAALTLTGCNTTSGNLALINGKIYTVNEAQPWAEAVVIQNEKIIYVGNVEGANPYLNDRSKVVDLKGRLVLPGIHDTHLHPLEAGSDRITCVLDSEQSLNTNLATLEECATGNGDEWVLGWGHGLESLLESHVAPKQLLDNINPNRPIAIMEETSHSVWVNSKALEMAGITANTPHPTGGAILKDANGNPTGILLDSAGDGIFELAFAPTPELKAINYEGLLYGLSEVAKNGITSIVDARVYWQRGYLDAWEKAEKNNTLTARTVLSLWAYPGMNDEEQIAHLKTLYRNDPESLLRISQIKFYSDGILHSSTAALHDPYLEYFDEVGPRGLNYFNKERLTHYTTELERTGFDMHIHAIGDRGVTESLDAIEAAQTANGKSGRHRITHLEMITDADKPRFSDLGVIADFQLAGEFTMPEHFSDMESVIGDRAHGMLPVREIFDTGATVTLSSDWDVSSLSPFVGMQNALSRGEQSLPSLAEVIKAYTLNGAYLMRQENVAGSIEVGKYGDLIIVDQNIFETPVNKIANTKVLTTLLGGEIVYGSLNL